MKGTLHIEIDFRSGVPIYIQIMEEVKRMIATGDLAPGDQLPTVRQLAADLRVNFNTVARAYKLLDEAGTISTQHGRGTYILENSSQEHSSSPPFEDLLHLTRQFLNEVFRLGYSAEDIKDVVEAQLRDRHHS